MKPFALLAVLGLVGIGPAAQAASLPRPVSFVDKAQAGPRQSHYVRAPRKLPRPISLVESSKPRPFRPGHYVRTR